MAQLKVYIAGPQVFYPEAEALKYFKRVEDMCRARGWEPLIPYDTPKPDIPPPTSLTIYEQNLAKIRNCDAVIANLDYFRGTEPDSGTVLEIGYAKALGKYIVGWSLGAHEVSIRTNDHFHFDMKDSDVPADAHMDPNYVYPDGYKTEHFGHAYNLMIQHTVNQFAGYSIDRAITALEISTFHREFVSSN